MRRRGGSAKPAVGAVEEEEEEEDGAAEVTFSDEVAVQKERTYYGAFTRGEQRFAVHDSVLLPIDKKGNFKSTGDRGESFWAAKLTSIWRDARTGRESRSERERAGGACGAYATAAR